MNSARLRTGRHWVPAFLTADGITEEAYRSWLHAKAAAHVRRDRNRGLAEVTGSAYRDAIHEAVLRSGGHDAYTGERLSWQLISRYDNEAARQGRHGYKAGFALLPTVDHVIASEKRATFAICSWRTNAAKGDLGRGAFVDLCRKVLLCAGYIVTPPPQAAERGS